MTNPTPLPFPQQWTVGNAALGYGGIPSAYRTTPELCAYFFHPGVTYNPWAHKTWCLCGRKKYPGNVYAGVFLASDGGALTEPTDTKAKD